MANAPDFTQAFETFFKNMPAMPKDFSDFEGSAKDMAEFNTKLNAIALEAAQKNIELSTKWTQDLISEMSGLNTPQDKPADYAEAVSKVATAQVQGTPERVGAFAEIAKKAQIEAVELIMNTTKELQTKVVKTTAAATKKAAKA